ncbi:hypothetical protein pb186bvf_012282 [Paramecium bursaria]
MNQSLDTPLQKMVRQVNSISVSQAQNNVIDAMKLSEQDKLFRQNNLNMNNKELQYLEVLNGEHVSIICYIEKENLEAIQNNKPPIYTAQRVQLPSIEGILLKKSPHWVQGYGRRKCELNNRVFKYWLINGELQGVLNFDLQFYDFQEIFDQKGFVVEFRLKPVGKCEKIFQFKGENLKQWCDLIKVHLDASMGRVQKLTTLCNVKQYWRNECLSIEQLLETAEDGDLLLFRGKDLNCQFQRAFTQSQYDHVAMIIRMEQNQIYFFEALPLHGVGLCRWQSFISRKWYELYEKICLRKLHVERDNNFRAKFHDFVNNNIGKQYSINPTKFLTFQSQIAMDQKKQENRTYFCSELVAKCYKHLNLLPIEYSSTQYWPGSFSQENKKLKLLYGSLSPEFLIDFSTICTQS